MIEGAPKKLTLMEEEATLTHLMSEYPDFPERVAQQMQEIREGKGIASRHYTGPDATVKFQGAPLEE